LTAAAFELIRSRLGDPLLGAGEISSLVQGLISEGTVAITEGGPEILTD